MWPYNDVTINKTDPVKIRLSGKDFESLSGNITWQHYMKILQNIKRL